MFRPEAVNKRLLTSAESTQANKGNALASETIMDSAAKLLMDTLAELLLLDANFCNLR